MYDKFLLFSPLFSSLLKSEGRIKEVAKPVFKLFCYYQKIIHSANYNKEDGLSANGEIPSKGNVSLL